MPRMFVIASLPSGTGRRVRALRADAQLLPYELNGSALRRDDSIEHLSRTAM